MIRLMKVLGVAVVAVLVAALVAFAVHRYGPRRTPEAQPPLGRLDGAAELEQLRREFNAAAGSVRVVALLSPT